MIQTQTLALDEATRAELADLSRLISLYRNDPERLRELVARHDAIVKRAPTKLYNQSEDI